MSASVFAVATMDTKAEEIAYVAQCLKDAGVAVKTVDVGTKDAAGVQPDVTRDEVLGGKSLPDSDDRGTAVTAMGEALTRYLVDKHKNGEVAAWIGGSGGTALITLPCECCPSACRS